MFLPDDTPIIFKLPRDKEYADIYFIHDLHYGSELFDAKDRPRAKLVFDKYNNKITKKNIECINCGSFLSFGGYGAKSAYRPQSDKLYVLRISGKKKSMQTIGFMYD